MTKNELWDLVTKVNITNNIAKDLKWLNNCDWEEFILLMSLRNPQSYGAMIQNRIIAQLNGKKVNIINIQKTIVVYIYFLWEHCIWPRSFIDELSI
jgi:hypothetical protein